MKKNIKNLMGVLFVIPLFLGAVLIYFLLLNTAEPQEYNPKKELTIEERKLVVKSEEKVKDEKKKHKGKEGDNTGPTIKEDLFIKEFDFQEQIYPRLQLLLDDDSGIYRVRIMLYNNDKLIGYLQKNPNTKDVLVEEEFVLDNYVVLDAYKLVKDYEGININYEIHAWDNNMNESVKKGKQPIKIVDRTSPEEIEAYWTYFINSEGEEIKVYSKEMKNDFEVYSVDDLPLLEENKIEKYEYGLIDENGNTLLKVGKPPIEGKKDIFSLHTDTEGENIFFVRAIDRNENKSEKIIKFYTDFTPPTGKMMLINGVEYYRAEKILVRINAEDNLSGVYRYRTANTKDDIFEQDWQEYENQFETKAKYKSGVWSIWCQLQDNAFNTSEPFEVSYAVKDKKTIDIKSNYEGREITTGINEKEYRKKGKLKIEKVEQ